MKAWKKEKDPSIRLEWIRAIAACGADDKGALKAVLKAAEKDKDELVRRSAPRARARAAPVLAAASPSSSRRPRPRPRRRGPALALGRCVEARGEIAALAERARAGVDGARRGGALSRAGRRQPLRSVEEHVRRVSEFKFLRPHLLPLDRVELRRRRPLSDVEHPARSRSRARQLAVPSSAFCSSRGAARSPGRDPDPRSRPGGHAPQTSEGSPLERPLRHRRRLGLAPRDVLGLARRAPRPSTGTRRAACCSIEPAVSSPSCSRRGTRSSPASTSSGSVRARTCGARSVPSTRSIRSCSRTWLPRGALAQGRGRGTGRRWAARESGWGAATSPSRPSSTRAPRTRPSASGSGRAIRTGPTCARRARRAGSIPPPWTSPPPYPDAPVIRGDIADYLAEVERFDADVGRALTLLEERGELERTVVVMTGDHGWPFPRGKTKAVRRPRQPTLVVRWPGMGGPSRRGAHPLARRSRAHVPGCLRGPRSRGHDRPEPRPAPARRARDAAPWRRRRHPREEAPHGGAARPIPGIPCARCAGSAGSTCATSSPKAGPPGAARRRAKRPFRDCDNGPTRCYLLGPR